MITYPEVIITSRPYFMPIAQHVRGKSRPKVSGKVDSVSSFPAKTGTNSENDEEECEGR